MTQRRKAVLAFLLSPGAAWIFFFFLLPGALIIVYSFLARKEGGGVLWTLDFSAYIKLFSPTGDALLNDFMIIFLRSLWWAALTSFVCLIVGYPLAYFIALQPAHVRNTYLFLVLIPFWTNFLVRTYAWKFILNNNGLINTILQSLNMGRIALINTPTAVLIGLVYGSLPFMVLPLYASIEKLDFGLVEAAQDLGATYPKVFLRVILPLTAPGIGAGIVLVFIPVSGQYIVPTILGGGKVAMLGNLLAQQFGPALNWPFGSAIAVVFMALLMVGVIFYLRTDRREEEGR
ncbi:MAG: ABC transporter permease [Caldilineae bacterium]|nr:MAG: ABC transporter permease [Caldilineae bacterium]